MENQTNIEKPKKESFLKRYSYYFILLGIVLLLALVILLSTLPTNNSSNNEQQEVNSNVIVFTSPMANATLLKGFSSTELQYDAILKEWSIHKAYDLQSGKEANVMACYDGTVESVSSNLIDGTVITINHGNNLKTVYKNLIDEVNVEVGGVVKQGDIIGKANAGMDQDSSEIKFEVWKDDKLVDPAGYLEITGK